MTTYDTTLNEMWQIKRELSEQFASWADYVINLTDYQKKMEQQGVRVVRLPIARRTPVVV